MVFKKYSKERCIHDSVQCNECWQCTHGNTVTLSEELNNPMACKGKIIYNCLVNWEELRANFTFAIPETYQESRYKARTLLDMLNDRIIFLYFHFVSPLVTEFEPVNSLFQATDADPEEMSKELLSHSKSLQARINDSDGSPLPIVKVDFGGKFEEETRAFLSSQADAVSALDKIKE